MARPVVGVTTERLYSRIPEYLRAADEKELTGGGYPLLRFLSLVVDDAALVEDNLIAFDYRGPSEGGRYEIADGIVRSLETSSLVDPTVADPAWLKWIGRLVGVNVTPDLSEAEARDAVTYATSGFRAGTKQAIADAAKTALTGTKFVAVYDHTISDPGDGTMWDVMLLTRGSETPDVAAVLQTVVRKQAKPAGVVLHHRAYDSAWDTVTTTYPDWNAIEAAGSWNTIQEAGL